MYKIFIRPLLFCFDAERVHHFTFRFLRLVCLVPGTKSVLRECFDFHHPALERKILGLTFKNPVGLAAGFDKDAILLDELSCFGFGFIEIGTVTPQPQPGNEKPRLFRLPEDQAIINRMGFNNSGGFAAAELLKKRNTGVRVGGNIGKNKNTPNEHASDDYAYCFEALYPYVDYFVINVSSPNTPGLRDLQEKGPLKKLLSEMKGLSLAKSKPKPVLLKISPDLTPGQLDDVIEILQSTATDGVIATNTTLSRMGLSTSENRVAEIGNGGLSGKPLADKSNEVIRYLRKALGPNYPIIGVGGIMTPADALSKMKARADLVQIYTGFIYEGPGFVKRINRAILKVSKS